MTHQPVSLFWCPQAKALPDSWVGGGSEPGKVEMERMCLLVKWGNLFWCLWEGQIYTFLVHLVSRIHVGFRVCMYASSQDSSVRSQNCTAEVSWASSLSLERESDNHCGWGRQRFRCEIQQYSPGHRTYRCFSRLCSVRKLVASIERTARYKTLLLFCLFSPLKEDRLVAVDLRGLDKRVKVRGKMRNFV